MSRFNVLLHGEAADAADELSIGAADEGELRAALTNALSRIDRLEKKLAEMADAQVER